MGVAQRKVDDDVGKRGKGKGEHKKQKRGEMDGMGGEMRTS